MAKRKKLKNVVISNEELTPTVIGYLDEKKSSPLFLIVLFAILFAFLYYVPNIDQYVKKYTGQETTDDTYEPIVEKTFDQNDAGKEVEFKDSSSIVIKEITFSKFSISDDTLSFTVTNADDNLVDFGSYGYYLYLLNESKNTLDIISLDDMVVYEEKTKTMTYSTSVLSADVKYLVIDSFKDTYLNEIELPFNTLTCSLNSNQYKYDFVDNKLSNVTYKFDVEASSPSQVKNYTSLKDTYSSIDGVIVSLNTTNGLHYQLSIDLTKVDVSQFNDELLYTKDSLAKVINYQMTNNGYTCN